MTKVAVIILSWNKKKIALETVKSLVATNTKGFEMEIIVVDSGSTDGSVEVLRKFQASNPNVQFKLIELSENLGFAEGNNVGIRDAIKRGFDYIALLNDDTRVDRNLVRNILGEHKKHKKAGAISPKIYFEKGYEYHKKYVKKDLGKVIWYAGGQIDWDNVYGSNANVDAVDSGQFAKTHETDFATGCFVMYKTKALKDVGLYDKKFFAYMEDADHAQRMKKGGWDVLFSPKGEMWHKVSQSSGIGSGLNDYFLTRNRMMFGFRYAKLRTKIALVRESFRLLVGGRKWQKIGIRDFYLRRFGKGSWQ